MSAAVVAGLVRGFSGFGSALVLAPALSALSALYGPTTAVPAALLLELALAVPFLPPAMRRVQLRQISVLALGALGTVPLGAWLLVTLDPQLIRWAISGLVLILVAIVAFGWRYHGPPTAVATTGALSGMLNGATGLAGPPVIFYYLSGADSAQRMRASFIVFFRFSSLTFQRSPLGMMCIPDMYENIPVLLWGE